MKLIYCPYYWLSLAFLYKLYQLGTTFYEWMTSWPCETNDKMCVNQLSVSLACFYTPGPDPGETIATSYSSYR